MQSIQISQASTTCDLSCR